MKISSVRLGHANNSSSTHSILINSGYKVRQSDSGDFQYGWDWFHLKDKEDKSKYLAALIYSALSSDMAEEHAGLIARELTGHDPKVEADEGYTYVDHQSVIAFPKKYGTKHAHHGFLKEFVQYVRDNPKISIRGGNDNSEDPGDQGYGGGPRDWSPRNGEMGESHPLNRLNRDNPHARIYGRKDGDWWTVYNREGGAKIRISFNDAAKPYLWAPRPELVDVKITDYCPHGCEFCYQSSTTKGKHADVGMIEKIFWELHRAEVFEVALGGGETTMHPEFAKILSIADGQGITPNFTTFNMAWTKDKEKVEAVIKHAGSFAVSSIDAFDELKKWNNNRHDTEAPEGTLQIPLGCYPEEQVRQVIKKAKKEYMPITFLGYKHFGRGEGFAQHPSDWIVDAVTGPDGLYRFGADSVFVEQYRDKLKDKGVSEKLMVNAEGAFSCYIDAVTLMIGPSSYTKEMHRLNDRDIFNMFPYVKTA